MRGNGAWHRQKGQARHTLTGLPPPQSLTKDKVSKGPQFRWHFPKDSQSFQDINLKRRFCLRRTKICQLCVNMVANNFIRDQHNKVLLSWVRAKTKMGACWPTPGPATSPTWLEWGQRWPPSAEWLCGPSWANQSPSLEFFLARTGGEKKSSFQCVSKYMSLALLETQPLSQGAVKS